MYTVYNLSFHVFQWYIILQLQEHCYKLNEGDMHKMVHFLTLLVEFLQLFHYQASILPIQTYKFMNPRIQADSQQAQ